MSAVEVKKNLLDSAQIDQLERLITTAHREDDILASGEVASTC